MPVQRPALAQPLDSPPAAAALAAPHAAGDGTLALDDATPFDPTPQAPVRLTAFDPAYRHLGQYLATARQGNALTVDPDGYPDAALPAGTLLRVTASAAALRELQAGLGVAYDAIDGLALTPGPAGPQGSQGVPGVKGDKGDTGAAGAAGQQGTKGDTGATGGQGTPGAKGDKGDAGAAGPSGVASAVAPLQYNGTYQVISLGTVPVALGGTGATTLAGLLKGNGTAALTTAAAGTDYLAPGNLQAGSNVTITQQGTSLVIAATGGGGGVPGGSSGQLQFNQAGALGGTAALITGADRPLGVVYSNTTFQTTGPANAHLNLENPDPHAQTQLQFTNGGAVTGKIRNDYVGGMNYLAYLNGGHGFFCGGDVGQANSHGVLSLQAASPLATTTNPGASGSFAHYQMRNAGGAALLQMYEWFGGGSAWIDMPAGSSGIGDGGPGSNAWIARAGNVANWFADAQVGDICYRGAGLRFGNDGDSCVMAITGGYLTVNSKGAGISPLSVRATGGQSADLFRCLDSGGNALGGYDNLGALRVARVADGAANAGTLYYSTDGGKLAFKDPGGTTHYLN